MKKTAFPKRLLTIILTLLLSLSLIAVFYLAVIMGDPQQDTAVEDTSAADQPLLPAQSPIELQDIQQLGQLLAAFPVQAMVLDADPSYVFSYGRVYDLAFEGGFARKMELCYLDGAGRQYLLQSVYPRRAYAMIPRGDYDIVADTSAALCGYPAVRMQNSQTTRYHIQGADGLYALVTPRLTPEETASLMQLTHLSTKLVMGE